MKKLSPINKSGTNNNDHNDRPVKNNPTRGIKTVGTIWICALSSK